MKLAHKTRGLTSRFFTKVFKIFSNKKQGGVGGNHVTTLSLFHKIHIIELYENGTFDTKAHLEYVPSKY